VNTAENRQDEETISLLRQLSAAGWSEKRIAAALGVRPATVRAWWTGKRWPQPEHFFALRRIVENQVNDYRLSR
jgi:transcriptional regulator with XRE-family HTH domain